MDEKKVDPSAPPVMPPPYEAQQAFLSQPAYSPQSGYAPQPGYAQEPRYVPQPGYPPQGYNPPPPGYPPQGFPPPPGYAPPVATPTYPGYAPPVSASAVVLQPTVVVPPQAQMKPANNLAISLVACLCCNGCCLGLVALILALSSDSAYEKGNVDEARQKGENAKKCAIVAIIVTIVAVVIGVIARSLVTYYGVHRDIDMMRSDWNN